MTLSPQVYRDAAELILADPKEPECCCSVINKATPCEWDYYFYFKALFYPKFRVGYWWDDPRLGIDPDRHLQRELALLFAAQILEDKNEVM